jgi:signal transduction histidine kinase/class 3 adenylate cyclase
MTEFLSKEHTILERPYMEFRPFGVDEHEQLIRDISGVFIASNVGYLEEYITAKTTDPQAGARAVDELCRLLNERMKDPAYHVTPGFLKNVWHSYSYEFHTFLREFCIVLSGDPQFHFNMARARRHDAISIGLLPSMLQIVGKSLALTQIYKLWPYFAQKYVKGSLMLEVGTVTDHSAVLRVKFTEHAYKQFGLYRRRCAELMCQTCKGGLLALPEKVHGLPAATVTDLTCMVNGDEWCEWEFTWKPEKRSHTHWPVWEMLVGSAAFGYLKAMYPSVSAAEALVICVVPAVMSWMIASHFMRARVRRLQDLIEKQERVVDARHEELREAYLQQEQKTVELRQKVSQLATLHKHIEELNVGLEAKVRERTSELERLNQVLKSTNEQLQEMDRLKNEFFANVSHEFRTPLTLSLGSFNELLKLSPTVQAKEQIQMGLRNTAQLLFLINEFLDLAKLDSGMMEVRKRCIDFAALVRGVAANFESAERRRIHFQGGSVPVPIEADSGQMKKVLFNLLSNAVKFSDPQNGQVWIRLASKGERVQLEVEDNGIGIPGGQLDRIFERFAQVDRGTTRHYQGTGIGLTLVKEMVTLHGGEISVESQLNRGSTFIVSLPRGNATADGIVTDEDGTVTPPVLEGKFSEVPILPADSSEGDNRPFVLVVEDNPDMRAYLARILGRRCRIVLAKDGIEGLEQAKALHPEVILTDLMMPRMSGHDLLKAVRADDVLRSTAVVLLTAHAGTEARLESLKAGADDYIAKPFDENEVLARVTNLIRLRIQERELLKLREERLTRFLPAELSELILSDRADAVLKSHRVEITVVFIDLRGFTAFAETAEPEEVLEVLQEYQTEMGCVISDHQGVIEHFSGDAIMIFLNDPIPVPNHAEQAVRMAIAMRSRIGQLKNRWGKKAFDLGAGIGVATGYATLGLIGSEKRKDYAAIGAVTNLAARLCGEAKHGQILISERVMHLVQGLASTESVGSLMLKGFHKPVPAYNVAADARGLTESGGLVEMGGPALLS